MTDHHQLALDDERLRDVGGNNNLALLSDDNGMVLTLTSVKVGGETEVRYPATFHIGFGQESEERVNEINRRLKEDGYDVPPPSRQHGSWTFYFRAPGGFTIEVLCHGQTGSPFTRRGKLPLSRSGLAHSLRPSCSACAPRLRPPGKQSGDGPTAAEG